MRSVRCRFGAGSTLTIPFVHLRLTVLLSAAPLTVLLTAAPLTAQPGQATTADARLVEAIEWYTGVTGRVDDARALALLTEAASDPANVLATMWTARIASRGRMGVARDEALARNIATTVIDRVRSLAARGDPEALFLMGTAYDEGLALDVDYPEALRWYSRAAARGHVLAAHNVGNMYRDGRGVDVDAEAAVRWWLRAARDGDVIPALRLGEAFEAGWGVSPNLDSARFWYGRAAAAGNAAAAGALERIGPPGARPTAPGVYPRSRPAG